jgi:hypothetical protein
VPLDAGGEAGTTGTTVHFHPDLAVPREDDASTVVDPGLLASCRPWLALEIQDLR